VSDHPTDHELDALLREVPLPAGFAERLRDALAPSDERLDAALAAVVVPSTVLLRLKEIPDDCALDEALNDLPAPLALIHRLRRTSWRDRLRDGGRVVWRGAIAASLFLAATVGLTALSDIALRRVLPPMPDPRQQAVIDSGPPAPEELRMELSLAGSPAPSSAASGSELLPDLLQPSRPGPAEQWFQLVAGGLRPFDDVMLMKYGVLGSPQYADDRLPELLAPRLPRPMGIEPPPVRGYDRAFFLKHRVFPPISPGANSKLGSLDVPLIPYSDVLSRLERSLAESRPIGDVRSEELLAAMDYRLPAAPVGKLAIRTAAGPSPFGGAEVGLLQVGVQAGSLAARPQAATHLVLAIDVSHTMGAAGRLEMVQFALGRLLDQIGPRDRLSLVLFDEEVRKVIEAASRADTAAIRDLLAGLTPRGGTNLAAGIQQAASLALSNAAGDRAARRLVLITDSEPRFSPETVAAVSELLQLAGETGVQLDVLDVSFREQVDSLFTQWASELHGDARRIGDGRQLYRSLAAALAGRDPAIAHDAKLKLQFNPKAVSAYRLIGHEANALTDVSPAGAEAEILAGEAATALVELWFQPEESDDLGMAELTWHDPATNQEQRLRQRISRVQFAATPREMPLPLWQAALAAQAGEVLHGSHDVLRQAGLRSGNSRGLAAVTDLAASANPKLVERPDLQRLLRLIRQIDRQGGR
jgi:Ca-activated chloride channel family protein